MLFSTIKGVAGNAHVFAPQKIYILQRGSRFTGPMLRAPVSYTFQFILCCENYVCTNHYDKLLHILHLLLHSLSHNIRTCLMTHDFGRVRGGIHVKHSVSFAKFYTPIHYRILGNFYIFARACYVF